MKEMLKGNLVWVFGAVFCAFILCFVSKDMPNATAAGWFVTVTGSAAAMVLQAWYQKKYELERYDWFHVGLAVVIFVFAGVIRALAEF